MKKLAILFISLLTLVSCQKNQHQAIPLKNHAKLVYHQPRQDNLSMSDMLYKFQNGLTAIYGEAFTNKAWH